MSSDLDLKGLAIDRADSRPPRKRRASMKRLIARYIIPGALIAGFLLLLAWALRDALLPRTPVTVVPVHVSRSQTQQEGTPLFRAPGWVEPRPTHIAVAALAPGTVENLLVVEDQIVKQGEPVATLVAEDARLTLDARAADLKLRRAELQLAEATLAAAKVRVGKPVHLEAQLAEAAAMLAATVTKFENLPYQKQSAEANLRFAEADFEGKTRAGPAVSGRAIDEARSKFEAAEALVEQLNRQTESLTVEVSALTQRRDALREQLELKTEEQRQLDEASAKVVAAQARVEQGAVALAEAQLQLDRMVIRAPVDGRVYRLWTSPGARLVPGMGHDDGHDGSTVVSMYQPDSLQVRTDVGFADLPQVRPGQPVLIELPAVNQPVEGEVLFLSSEADIQKNTLEVKVAIIDPPEVFKPEMLVSITFLAPPQDESKQAAAQRDRLFVPKRLVRKDEAGSFVWVADQASGTARRVAIETGRRGTSELIEVTSGLNVASRLIASPAEGVSDGLRIRVTDEDPQLGTSGETTE
jgi:HlyD family secretion protein